MKRLKEKLKINSTKDALPHRDITETIIQRAGMQDKLQFSTYEAQV